MIEVKFKEDDHGNLLSFEITGHAGYGVEGEDIICAAVSVLAIETVNSVERLAGYQMLVDEAMKKAGISMRKYFPKGKRNSNTLRRFY